MDVGSAAVDEKINEVLLKTERAYLYVILIAAIGLHILFCF